MNVIHKIDEVIDAAKAIEGHRQTLNAVRARMGAATPFSRYEEWDRLLMELKHDFADGLKAVEEIRAEYDKVCAECGRR